MIVNKCSENLLKKSKKLYENYRDNCTVVQRMLEKYKKGAVVLDGARIGRDCIIGAGSLVTKNTVIPDGSLVMGSPAKIKRNLTWEEKLSIIENSKEYIIVSAEMQRQGVL